MTKTAIRTRIQRERAAREKRARERFAQQTGVPYSLRVKNLQSGESEW